MSESTDTRSTDYIKQELNTHTPRYMIANYRTSTIKIRAKKKTDYQKRHKN